MTTSDPQEQRVAAQVRQALRDLNRPARLAANPLLAGYYLSRRGGHEHVANRLHLSRSTYFRRLNHGIG